MTSSGFFEAIVVGDKPKELMKPYDSNNKTETRVVAKYEDRLLLRMNAINEYLNIVNSDDISAGIRNYYQEELNGLYKMSPEESYFYLTSDYDYDENNNAITDANPDGRYSFFQEAKLFSVPFITKEGRETFQAKKCDVDWDKMHLHGQEIYQRAWEMVMEGDEPQTDYEKTIYENMKERTTYFQNFGTKEQYVIQSTAFWAYAFIDKDGWHELEENENQFEWVKNFYERFIVPLDDDELLTIYECKK